MRDVLHPTNSVVVYALRNYRTTRRTLGRELARFPVVTASHAGARSSASSTTLLRARAQLGDPCRRPAARARSASGARRRRGRRAGAGPTRTRSGGAAPSPSPAGRPCLPEAGGRGCASGGSPGAPYGSGARRLVAHSLRGSAPAPLDEADDPHRRLLHRELGDVDDRAAQRLWSFAASSSSAYTPSSSA